MAAVKEPVYRSYNQYLEETFGGKTYKVVVSSGLTCPTRDGTLAKRGCAFCDVRGSSSFHAKKGRGAEVIDQLTSRIPPIRERFNSKYFLAYFQSYTNTYTDDIEYLRELYSSALSLDPSYGVRGLCIGTRPDCLADPVLDLIESFAKNHYVSVELGVQSFEDETLDWLVRGHSAECSLDAIARLKARAPHAHICVHLMFGNPTDPKDAPVRAARLLNQAGVEGVKLHQLMVLENTDLAVRFRETPFETVSIEGYTQIVYDFLENLDPKIYVERMSANATHPEECIAPTWSRDRWLPHNFMRNWLAEHDCVQGRRIG